MARPRLGPASVSAFSASSVRQVYAVAGGVSNQLPTARIFRSGLEE